MKTTLNFSEEGNYFVSDAISGQSVATIHINTDKNANIELFRTIDADNLGWAPMSRIESHGVWEDDIIIPDGVSIRIRVDVEPTDAEYLAADTPENNQPEGDGDNEPEGDGDNEPEGDGDNEPEGDGDNEPEES